MVGIMESILEILDLVIGKHLTLRGEMLVTETAWDFPELLNLSKQASMDSRVC